MSAIVRPIKWFYHEFGLAAIHETGRNAYLIILARALRMFAYGTNSLILAIFFSALKYTDHQIGLFMTLTLVGDVLLGTFLTLVADKVGRRKVLIGGSFLMVLTGVVFAVFENFFILLMAAVVGVVSVTGGDFGPFRSIEESVLSQLTTPSTRPDVLAWYVTISAIGSSLGSEVSGRLIHALQNVGWEVVPIYHALFWIYAIMGVTNAILMLMLSDACELQTTDTYSQVPQDEAEAEMSSTQRPTGSTLKEYRRETRSIMYKLWILLACDSVADGMVPYSLTNYYMDIKFHPAKSTLGDVTSASYFLAAIGSTFAGPLARKIGLINTMVFTHVPSSAAVLFFPAPPYFWLTAVLLLVRAGLNNMDQAPRSAFIAAVVKPEERTAVIGITSTIRTVAATSGPTITGLLAAKEAFWIAFVAAGICRLAYDFGLWYLFSTVKVEEGGGVGDKEAANRLSDEETSLEMASLASSDDEDSSPWAANGRRSPPKAADGYAQAQPNDGMASVMHMNPNSSLQAPQGGLDRVRSRSPHRSSTAEDIL
ncbi:uncharacterized protein AB675_10621 [Cyphellophora attinorum]|uniref:Putative membrane protein n=1 Tax=Cyphellophora attinorum TaxID=1664694 RepID=A0A0N1HRI6_9EURO|nr:uncharacterized protein AB675_10621 [Phialophora attinorum]KPI40900.1 putative membrane protein [Phialophora attinorum]